MKTTSSFYSTASQFLYAAKPLFLIINIMLEQYKVFFSIILNTKTMLHDFTVLYWS